MTERRQCYAAVSALALYVFLNFVLLDGSYIRVHDNLDITVPSYKVLTDYGLMFAGLGETFHGMFQGVSRDSLPGEANVGVLMFYLMGPLYAYVFNEAVARSVAYAGMALLLRRYSREPLVVHGVALLYAVLPSYLTNSKFLTDTGMPLVLWCFLEIRDGRGSPLKWLAIFVYPLYSNLIIGGFSVVLLLALLLAHDAIKERRFNAPLFSAFAVLCSLYLLSQYRMFYFMLAVAEPSHRSIWPVGGGGLPGSLKSGVSIFLLGSGEWRTYHSPLITGTAAFSLVAASRGKLPERGAIVKFLLAAAAVSFIAGLWSWDAWNPLKTKVEILRTFQFGRISVLNVAFWYVIFALSLSVIYRMRHGRAAAAALLALQAALLVANAHAAKAWAKNGLIAVTEARGIEIKTGGYPLSRVPTYRQFFAEDLFGEIAEYIGRDKKTYSVVSIGIEPAVPLYNGFYTLDGHSQIYPLAYKRKFRRVIERELAKDAALLAYFDEWGNRCYIFADELNGVAVVDKRKGITLKDLELNTVALKEMGGEYIFSAVEITNYRENGIELMRTFENDGSFYRIFLYKVL